MSVPGGSGRAWAAVAAVIFLGLLMRRVCAGNQSNARRFRCRHGSERTLERYRFAGWLRSPWSKRRWSIPG